MPVGAIQTRLPALPSINVAHWQSPRRRTATTRLALLVRGLEAGPPPPYDRQPLASQARPSPLQRLPATLASPSDRRRKKRAVISIMIGRALCTSCAIDRGPPSEAGRRRDRGISLCHLFQVPISVFISHVSPRHGSASPRSRSSLFACLHPPSSSNSPSLCNPQIVLALPSQLMKQSVVHSPCAIREPCWRPRSFLSPLG